MNDFLKVTGLKKSFGSHAVLENVNFSVRESEVVSIIGPSGSGKTTLLRLIAGLEKPGEGQIIFQKQGSTVGIVFQEFNLWPHMTVLQNIIEAPVIVKKTQKEQAIVHAKELLEKVGLQSKSNKYPSQLSGGEKQRVAIARSLAMNPKMLLLDEITSNLDPERIYDINNIIKKLVKDGFTMLIASHDFSFVQEISDKVLFLDNGKIIESGTPIKVFKNPSEKRTKEFLSKVLGK